MQHRHPSASAKPLEDSSGIGSLGSAWPCSVGMDQPSPGQPAPPMKALPDNAWRTAQAAGRAERAIDRNPPKHPSMTELYRSKVEDLPAALQREDTRLEASEMLRGLIDSIVLMPEKAQLRIELRGNLAAMLTVSQKTTRSPETGDLELKIAMVAGACNLLNLEFSWTAA